MKCLNPKSSEQVGGTYAQDGKIQVGHPLTVLNGVEFRIYPKVSGFNL